MIATYGAQNWCKNCHGGKTFADPCRRWWQFWKRVNCGHCGGTGLQQPPGWPDEDRMRALRPAPPPAPPSNSVTIHRGPSRLITIGDYFALDPWDVKRIEPREHGGFSIITDEVELCVDKENYKAGVFQTDEALLTDLTQEINAARLLHLAKESGCCGKCGEQTIPGIQF